MHYYQHHIGDFIKDTAHLDDHQLAAYLRMLWSYYSSECPISGAIEDVAFAMRSDEKTVRLLLRHFFTETPSGWVHSRCDREIQAFREKGEKARKSASARWNDANAMRTQCERNANEGVFDANHKPLTINQEPDLIDPIGSKSGARLPDCPYRRILELWGKKLPHLPQPRTWEGARKTAMRCRWAQAAKPSAYSPEGYASEEAGLRWWESFFGYIAESKLGAGFESKGRHWQPDLEWVVNASNFQKIIDGKYDK